VKNPGPSDRKAEQDFRLKLCPDIAEPYGGAVHLLFAPTFTKFLKQFHVQQQKVSNRVKTGSPLLVNLTDNKMVAAD